MEESSDEQRPIQIQRQTFCQNHQLTWVYGFGFLRPGVKGHFKDLFFLVTTTYLTELCKNTLSMLIILFNV